MDVRSYRLSVLDQILLLEGECWIFQWVKEQKQHATGDRSSGTLGPSATSGALVPRPISRLYIHNLYINQAGSPLEYPAGGHSSLSTHTHRMSCVSYGPMAGLLSRLEAISKCKANVLQYVLTHMYLIHSFTFGRLPHELMIPFSNRK